MINAFSLLKRKPDLSVDAFQEHWRTEHAELITRLPGVVRYVQSHPLPEMYDKAEPAYDGVAELWARESRVFRDIATSDAYAAVQADEEKFLDRKAIELVLTEEHVIKDGTVAVDGVKYIELFKRRSDMTVEEFQSHWREIYGPQIAALPSVDRYAQYHARLGAYAKGREPAYDGFDISWFKSGVGEEAGRSQTDFLAVDECQQILTRELVIIG
jgi:uncharacterized protein (TIGR02118 family)